MDVAGRLESSVVACWLLSHFRQPDFCSSVEILPTGCQHVVLQTIRSNRIGVALVAFVLESSNRWCCPTSGNQTVEVFLMLGRPHTCTRWQDSLIGGLFGQVNFVRVWSILSVAV